MLVTAAGLALMTTLQADSPYWQGMVWLALVGIGSGMFNSPNTAAMMGTVPTERRGIAAGARTMLQNTGAVISIAFVLAIVTNAIPKQVLFAIFSGLASGLSSAQLDPFIHNMHTALWVLAATSVLGAGVSLLRPRHDSPPAEVQRFTALPGPQRVAPTRAETTSGQAQRFMAPAEPQRVAPTEER
jgi:MFS family permease